MTSTSSFDVGEVLACALHHLRQVVKHAARLRCVAQHCGKRKGVPAANVHDALEVAEIIGLGNCA